MAETPKWGYPNPEGEGARRTGIQAGASFGPVGTRAKPNSLSLRKTKPCASEAGRRVAQHFAGVAGRELLLY